MFCSTEQESNSTFEMHAVSCIMHKLHYFFFLILCSKFPELYRWFKEFLGYKESDKIEPPHQPKERSQGELYTEIGKFNILSSSISLLPFIDFHNVASRFCPIV